MALYIAHSIFHLARLSYVRPETFGPYYVSCFNEHPKVAFRPNLEAFKYIYALSELF